MLKVTNMVTAECTTDFRKTEPAKSPKARKYKWEQQKSLKIHGFRIRPHLANNILTQNVTSLEVKTKENNDASQTLPPHYKHPLAFTMSWFWTRNCVTSHWLFLATNWLQKPSLVHSCTRRDWSSSRFKQSVPCNQSRSRLQIHHDAAGHVLASARLRKEPWWWTLGHVDAALSNWPCAKRTNTE